MSETSPATPKNVGRETMVMPPTRRIDRRAHFRSPVLEVVEVQFTWDDHVWNGRLRDVSPGGACIDYTEGGSLNVPPGTPVDFTLKHHQETVERPAKVVWYKLVEGRWRMGIEFLRKDPECFGLLLLDRVKIDPTWALRVSPSLALRRLVLPFASDDKNTFVACQEVPDPQTCQALDKIFNLPIKYEIAEPASLKRALERVYGDLQNNPSLQHRTRSVDLRTQQTLQPEDVVGLCDELLHAAILRQASDIHIDPEQAGLNVRFRVDGVLDTYRRLPINAHNGIISRFKVLSGMDIAEKRAPQDGGFKHRYGRGQHTVDMRVATLPTKHGERMTLRLLALQTESLTLEKLGMSPRDLKIFEETLDRPHGMILLTGPTGSGKSTTLYAGIRKLLSREGLNIITVEDPIEYEIPGVAQTEIDQADKVTFLKALRSVLRHDPDVVMIGEIRDRETADVAIKASLTGHLVFSTLHTNSAVSVVTRLVDMGIDRFLVAATLRLAVAQRLVRRLCPRCRKPRPLTPAESVALGNSDVGARTVHDAVGCIYCGNRGYIGRLGIFEMLPFDDQWAHHIARGADETELTAYMRSRHIETLVDDGMEKCLNGTTSVKEVVSAVTAW